ncbi:MAG: hypothetical protein QM765_14380 [Myxococcales bacterium]
MSSRSFLFILGVLPLCATTARAAPGLLLPAPIYAKPGAERPFVVRRAQLAAGFDAHGVALTLSQGDGMVRGVRWSLVGTSAPQPLPEEPLPVTVRVQERGSDQVTSLQGWGALRWPQALPGMDLVWRSLPQSDEWRVEAQAGAGWRSVGVEVEGVDAVELDADGTLRMRVGAGTLVEAGLSCTQPGLGDEPARVVPCSYGEVRELGAGLWRYSVEAGPLDRSRPLVVDPFVLWSVPFGGQGMDAVAGGCQVSNRSVYVVAGPTESDSFPGTSTSGSAGNPDGFVSTIRSDLSALETMYLDGNGYDSVAAVACSGSAVYLTGTTASDDSETSGTAMPEGGRDAFVAKFSVLPLTKDALIYLGTPDIDEGKAVAVNESIGRVAVAAATDATCPIPGPNCRQASVWLLDTTLASTLWSTTVGGSGDDVPHALAITNDAVVHVAGTTTSARWPGATDSDQHAPGLFAVTRRPTAPLVGFLAGLSAANTYAHFSWIGGNEATNVTALVAAPDNSLFLAGFTTSGTQGFGQDDDGNDVHGIYPKGDGGVVDQDLTVGGSLDPETEGFVMKLSGYSGSGWNLWKREWCTALGEKMNEEIYGLSLSDAGLLVSGNIHASPDAGGFRGLPGLLPLQTGQSPSLADSFLVQLSATGTSATSRIFGASGDDFTVGAFVSGFGRANPVIMVGSTTSGVNATVPFPSQGTSFPTAPRGDMDAFVLATDLTPPEAQSVMDIGDTTLVDTDTASGLRACWVFADSQDAKFSFELGYSIVSGDCATKAATLAIPFVKMGDQTCGSVTGGNVGTTYYAVVRAANSTGLSSVACSDGVLLQPSDAGTVGPGLDASLPADAAAAVPDASAGPDAALDLDASGPAADAGGAGRDASRPDSSEEPADSGSLADASAASDSGAASPADASVIGPDGGPAEADAGEPPLTGVLGWSCGCGSGGGAGGSGLAWLVALAALLRRRGI